MTEQSNAYHQKAYLETLQNFNRQEGETTLAAQGWVNELNVKEELTPTNAANDDEPNPAAWSGKTGLKASPVAYSAKRIIPLSSNLTSRCSEQANVWYLMYRLIWK